MLNHMNCCSRRFLISRFLDRLRTKDLANSSLISRRLRHSLKGVLGVALFSGVVATQDASAQVVLKQLAPGVLKRVEAHDPDPCFVTSCKLKLGFQIQGKASPQNTRLNLKFGNKSFKQQDLIKRQCQQGRAGDQPYLFAGKVLIVDPGCLNVSTKKINKKNTGQIDLAKFLDSLTKLKTSLVGAGLSATSADQLIEIIKGLVNSSLVQVTPVPTGTATQAPVVTVTAVPSRAPITTPAPVVTGGAQCSGAIIDNKSYPCRDGNMYSVIYYPATCENSARPQCPQDYSEVQRVCFGNNQCQVNCRKACTTCGTSQVKDDTTTYACWSGVEYTIRYHPFSCQTSCPSGFVSDYQGCKDSGECQINCKRSCSGAPGPVPSRTVTAVPSTTVTALPTVSPVPSITATRTVVPTVTVPSTSVVNRCDSKYVMVNGACKFGMRDSKCIAAAAGNLNSPDPTTLCINQSGTMIPYKGCDDGSNLGRNCAAGQARDQRCSEADFPNHPYITSFNTPKEVQPGYFGVYCCTQPTVGGAQPPPSGVSCQLVSAEDKYDHSFPVTDPNTLQPNQRVDCNQGGQASAMKNCGVTPSNPYGNGSCGFKVVFGATKAMSATVINDYRCCSGRANYVSHIIGGNGPEGRKGEHANYMCCGADGEPDCNG